MEAKLKYLEFVQDVITRMNTNSFLIKAWIVTIISILLTLAAKDVELRYLYISWFAILVFWALDGFYLSQERQYRGLYNRVRQLKAEEIDFDMSARAFQSSNTNWMASIFSKTLVLFYLSLLIITGIITYVMAV